MSKYVRSTGYSETADAFRGVLLGCAIGDALGAPVEVVPPAQASAYAVQLRDLKPAAVNQISTFTDDTQCSRELVRSIIAAHGTFDLNVFADHLLQLNQSKQLAFAGKTTLVSLGRIAKGYPAHEGADPKGRATNGAAMRVGPIGVLYWKDLAAVKRVAMLQCLVTHAHPLAQLGAVAVAISVALAVRASHDGMPIDPAYFCEELSRWTAGISSEYPDFGVVLQKMLHAPTNEEALKLMGPVPSNFRSSTKDAPVSTFAPHTALWSINCFLRQPTQYWDAIIMALSVGGDMDTTAAITGAIAGAHIGASGILRDRKYAPLAERICDISAKNARWTKSQLLALADRADEQIARHDARARRRATWLAWVGLAVTGILSAA